MGIVTCGVWAGNEAGESQDGGLAIWQSELWYFCPSFSAHVRPGRNVGHPSCSLRVRILTGEVPVSAVVSHISRKTSEMPRISCTQRWTRSRVRLS